MTNSTAKSNVSQRVDSKVIEKWRSSGYPFSPETLLAFGATTKCFPESQSDYIVVPVIWKKKNDRAAPRGVVTI